MASGESSGTKSNAALGFLTIVEHEPHGLFGGYLVLNTAGRPVEFHCTAPIRPNRAQQILYGPTLEPFLFGEHIGRTLLEKATSPPLVVCTDRRAALSLREHVEVPVALVLDGENEAEASASLSESSYKQWRVDGPHVVGSALSEFRLGCNHLAVLNRATNDRQQIQDRLGEIAETFVLAEPFTRIREAIDEARQGG